jgi:biotin transport system substrate-specific component
MSAPATFLPIAPARAGLAGRVVAVVAGSLLLTLSAKVQVPFWPVPMTLQTGAVLLLAILMGPRLALATVALYLAQGAVGLPVFAGTPAKGLGLAYMAGPTGGYLLGFAVAAVLTGWLAARRATPLALIAGATLGMASIYALGLAWLTNWVPAAQVFAVGALPFLLGDAVKIGLAVALALAVRGALRTRRTA